MESRESLEADCLLFISGVWAQRGASRQCDRHQSPAGRREKEAPGLYLNTVSEQYPRQACARRYYAHCQNSVKFISHERERGREKRGVEPNKTSCDPDNSVISGPMQTHGINWRDSPHEAAAIEEFLTKRGSFEPRLL